LIFADPAYFCSNFNRMEKKKSNKGIYWLVFIISAAAFAYAIQTHWEWVTLILPFLTTSFVKALDII
jgi:predicted transposase YbfD/YdcC